MVCVVAFVVLAVVVVVVVVLVVAVVDAVTVDIVVAVVVGPRSLTLKYGQVKVRSEIAEILFFL